jgi:isoquinoline 1-oxidoreductase beta subunit
MGEPGLPPLAPAFANAIARLTGKPLRQLPFNIESKS